MGIGVILALCELKEENAKITPMPMKGYGQRGAGDRLRRPKVRKHLFLKRINQKLYSQNQTYFTIRGGSLKNIAKKIIPKVPISKDP